MKREEGKEEKGRVAGCVCDVGGTLVDSMGMDSMGFDSMEMESKGMDSMGFGNMGMDSMAVDIMEADIIEMNSASGLARSLTWVRLPAQR